MEFEVNSVKETGNVVKVHDMQMTKTKAKLIANFTIAKNLTKETTMFINVRAWNEAAENIYSLNAGDKVFVQGKLGQDKEGRMVIDINRKSDIQIIHSKTFDQVGYMPDQFTKQEAQNQIQSMLENKKED